MNIKSKKNKCGKLVYECNHKTLSQYLIIFSFLFWRFRHIFQIQTSVAGYWSKQFRCVKLSAHGKTHKKSWVNGEKKKKKKKRFFNLSCVVLQCQNWLLKRDSVDSRMKKKKKIFLFMLVRLLCETLYYESLEPLLL